VENNKEKKKVLFLIHTLGIGGAERVLVNLANTLVEKGYDVTVMTVIDTGALKRELSIYVKYKTMFRIGKQKSTESGSLNANFSTAKGVMKKLYQYFWKHMNAELIYSMFVKENYDYEIAFLEGICAKIIAASTNASSMKYAWLHVDIINENKSDAFFKSIDNEREVYGKFDNLICVSEYVKKQAQTKLKIDENKFLTLYNPINAFEVRNKAMRTSVKVKEGFTFCSIGRLTKQKGFDRLIEAVDLLKKKSYLFYVYIIGEGPDYEKLNTTIRDRNLNDRIKLLGYMSNPFGYLAETSMFISSSRTEGFSTVACEAVILGKACLVTDCSGMYELYGDNEFGYITENSTNGIYDGMKMFLDNPDMIRFYECQSSKNAKRFDINRLVDEISNKLF
jgi:glycosyltransferase involved in cell wall biosynthesis